jgi:hypothetical protein
MAFDDAWIRRPDSKHFEVNSFANRGMIDPQRFHRLIFSIEVGWLLRERDQSERALLGVVWPFARSACRNLVPGRPEDFFGEAYSKSWAGGVTHFR